MSFQTHIAVKHSFWIIMALFHKTTIITDKNYNKSTLYQGFFKVHLVKYPPQTELFVYKMHPLTCSIMKSSTQKHFADKMHFVEMLTKIFFFLGKMYFCAMKDALWLVLSFVHEKMNSTFILTLHEHEMECMCVKSQNHSLVQKFVHEI